MKYLLFILIFTIGCSGKLRVDITQDKPDRGKIEYNQTCDMCGALWSITPSDPTKEVPKTVEWCFHDGAYCQTGLLLIIELLEGRTLESVEFLDLVSKKKFLNHCLNCGSCRHAAFDPEEWHTIIDNIREKSNDKQK